MIKPHNYFSLVFTLLTTVVLTSCTFTYVPFIPANPQLREARFLMSESQGLRVEEEQLRLDITIKEIPKSDWLAVQWFSPLSKEVASDSKWLEVVEGEEVSEHSLSFDLPVDITLTPGYWRAVVSYQGRLIRQFGYDYSLVEDIPEEAVSEDLDEQSSEATNLNEETSSETMSEENSNESTENDGN